jgi:hypothetical protein
LSFGPTASSPPSSAALATRRASSSLTGSARFRRASSTTRPRRSKICTDHKDAVGRIRVKWMSSRGHLEARTSDRRASCGDVTPSMRGATNDGSGLSQGTIRASAAILARVTRWPSLGRWCAIERADCAGDGRRPPEPLRFQAATGRAAPRFRRWAGLRGSAASHAAWIGRRPLVLIGRGEHYK